MSKDFLYLMAVGDSYGMKYEFVAHAQDKDATDLFHGRHPKFGEYITGNYTDDTQMSLANLELLVEKRAQGVTTFTDDEFIEKWIGAFKRDPHVGYSKFFYDVMMKCETAADFYACGLNPNHSRAAGAAMRAGPFGLLSDIEEVKALAVQQAKLTHNNPTGINTALSVALTVHFFHHGGSRADLPAFLETHIGKGWDGVEEYKEDDTGNGLKIMKQSMKVLLSAKTTSELVLAVINNDAKSDTDTICAIAMCMASRTPEIKNDFPQTLLDGVENGAYGADYLKALDAKALALFPASNLYKKPTAPAAQKKKGFGLG